MDEDAAVDEIISDYKSQTGRGTVGFATIFDLVVEALIQNGMEGQLAEFKAEGLLHARDDVI